MHCAAHGHNLFYNTKKKRRAEVGRLPALSCQQSRDAMVARWQPVGKYWIQVVVATARRAMRSTDSPRSEPEGMSAACTRMGVS